MVLTYAGLLVAGIPFAAFFAVFTAVAMIVPYFGAIVSSIPPILFALTISPGKAIIVAAIYIVAHQVEGNVIQPLVVARTVKLHPALVAVGVVAVERLFGFVGLIVAVPILATLKILIEELWVKPLERRSRSTAAITGSDSRRRACAAERRKQLKPVRAQRVTAAPRLRERERCPDERAHCLEDQGLGSRRHP